MTRIKVVVEATVLVFTKYKYNDEYNERKDVPTNVVFVVKLCTLFLYIPILVKSTHDLF